MSVIFLRTVDDLVRTFGVPEEARQNLGPNVLRYHDQIFQEAMANLANNLYSARTEDYFPLVRVDESESVKVNWAAEGF
jgi:hypothetical protein